MRKWDGLSAFLLLVACGLTAFLGWSGFRGFGIWDEGYYLLAARNPGDVGALATSFYHYTGGLFRVVGYDIGMFRLAGLGLLAVACIVFAHGFRSAGTALSAQARTTQHFAGLVSIVYVGALVYYGTFALATPSYNLLTSICLTAAAGTTLAALGAEAVRGDSRRSMLWMLATGVLLGMQFFFKATSFALMAAAVVALVSLWPGLQPRPRLRLLGAIALGMAVWMAAHFAVFETPAAFAAKIRLSHEYESRLGMGTGRFDPLRFALDFLRLGKDMLLRSIPAFAAIALLLIAMRRMRGSASHARAAVVSWLGVAVACAFLVAAGYHLGGYAVIDHARLLVGVYLFWLVALTLIAGINAALLVESRPTAADLLLFFFLVAIPLAGAYGTINFIGYNLPLTLAPWFAALLLVCAFLEKCAVPLRAPIQLAVAAFAASQLVTAYLRAPYDGFSGIREQTRPVRAGSQPLELFVDPPTAAALDQLKAAAERCGFRSGDDILGFYQTPGLVFALGGRSPLTPFFVGWRNGHVGAAYLLEEIPRERLRIAFVLTHVRPSETLPSLQAAGREFPRDYHACGDTIWPATATRVTLWKPHAEVRPN